MPFTEDEKCGIYKLRLSGLTFVEIANRYGVDVSTVRLVYFKQEWKMEHLDDWDLNASARLKSMIERYEIKSMDDLRRVVATNKIRKFRNVGPKTIAEARKFCGFNE
jgi:uncharacterized protein YjcR